MFRDMGQLAAHLEEPPAQATAGWLREDLPRGEYLAWVAEDKGSPGDLIGGAGVQLRPILPRPLMNALEERGIRRIVLHASAHGRRLYERLGFVQTNEMRIEKKS